MEKTKKTLNERAIKLSLKAAEIERAVFIVVENEVGDGFDVHVMGNVDQLSKMCFQAVYKSEKVADIFNRVLIETSLRKIDDLMNKRNLLAKKAEPVL